MVEKEDKGPADEQWVDEVVARAVERSIENSPEFMPSDLEADTGQDPSKLPAYTSPETGSDDLHEGRSILAKDSFLSPYPDDEAHEEGIEAEDERSRKKPVKNFLEWEAVILGALLVAFLIKTFLMQAYYIPSSSMAPTLQVGDRVLVNKLSYKVGDIGRGDLVVFRSPSTEDSGKTDLIKRVIGLEGELIEIIDGRIYVTESGSSTRQALVEPYLSSSTSTEMPNGFQDTDSCEVATETSCLIPENYVFVLGDNRAGSRDSRFFGPIEEDMVVGRAFIRLWPISSLKFL